MHSIDCNRCPFGFVGDLVCLDCPTGYEIVRMNRLSRDGDILNVRKHFYMSVVRTKRTRRCITDSTLVLSEVQIEVRKRVAYVAGSEMELTTFSQIGRRCVQCGRDSVVFEVPPDAKCPMCERGELQKGFCGPYPPAPGL